MKSKLLYILILLLSMTIFSSCKDDSEYSPDGEVMVSFSFSMQQAMTRAGHMWGDNLDDNQDNDYEISVGEDYDTRIKVKSLRAFIYDAQGYICEITNKTYFELDDVIGSNSIEPDRYRFLGYIQLTPEVYDRVKGKTCKIMLVANSTLGDTPEQFGSTTFSANDITLPNGFIPMWGVTSKVLTLESQQDLGTIYLLRSAAKVEVKLSDQLVADGYEIKETFINKYATTGYWFPNGWNTGTNTTSLAHSDCYNPTTNSLSDAAKYFTNNSAKSSCVVYLPEMATSQSDISIVLTKGNSEYPFYNAIKFANYVNGFANNETFNVVRNHHYQYTINKVNVGSNLELTCVVQPWTLVEESWDYTDVPAVYDGGYITWASGTAVNANRVSITPSTPNAKFTFGLSSPAGATWRAEFVTIKGKQNAFQFTEVEGGNNHTSYATGDVGKLITLTIAATGQATNENNEAYLRISAILPDGRTIRVSDMLYSANQGEQKEYVIVQIP